MASTEFGVNDAQTVKRWSQEALKEIFDQTYFRRFAGRSKNSIIRVLNELERDAGDEIKFDLRVQTRAKGIAGDGELRGYEEKLQYYQDTVLVNQLRQAHEFGQMSQQRTVHDLRMDGRDSLAEWYRGKFDATMFAYLAGLVGDGEESEMPDVDFSGNALRAPSADNLLDRTGSTMILTNISEAKAKAKVLNPRIEPTMVNGQPKWVIVCHPYAIMQMKIAAGDNTWNLIHQNASTRGGTNQIYTGALGEYDGVVIHESEFIPRTGTVSHNVFLGANAGAFAMANAYKKIERGESGGGGYFRWHEDVWDYGNRQGVAGAACWGVQKCQFNSVDRGVIRVDTTDAAPA